MNFKPMLILPLALIAANSLADAKNVSSTKQDPQKIDSPAPKSLDNIDKSQNSRINYLENQVKEMKSQIDNLNLHHNNVYPHTPSVIASPFFGVRDAYDAGDLITNFSSINEDLIILKQRQQNEDYLTSIGMEQPKRSIIELSGYVEGRALGIDQYNNPWSSAKSEIDLSGAELDVLAEVSKWASAFMAVSYSNTATFTGARIPNSNVYIDRAIITIGNLNYFPLYGTIGQFNVPFGSYDYNYMITDTLTQTLGKTKARAIELGIAKSGFNLSAYIFRGDSYEENHSNINNGGANLGYKYTGEEFNTNLGAGYIYNLVDSNGIQSTGADVGFMGFNANSSYEKIDNRVPAFDAHANFGWGPFNVMGEYITGLKSFSTNDLTFNGDGADVKALTIAGNIKYNIFERPSFLSVGYGRTWDCLALNIPRHSISATIGTSIWKHTVEKIEYRHDINYSADDFATGKTDIVTPQWNTRNLGIAQIDVYF